jgi:hypothetical protein
MGKNKAKSNHYANKGGATAVRGPTLCIDTIADPEGLQKHIEMLLAPSTRLSWEEFKEKHKDALEDRMGKGIEKETRQHREMLDEERRDKLARGVNHDRDGKKNRKDKQKNRKNRKDLKKGRGEGEDEGIEVGGGGVRLSDFQKKGYGDTSDSDVSHDSRERDASPTPAWLLPMSEQEAEQKRAVVAQAAQAAALAQGLCQSGQSMAPSSDYVLLAIRILTNTNVAERRKRQWADYGPGRLAAAEAGSEQLEAAQRAELEAVFEQGVQGGGGGVSGGWEGEGGHAPGGGGGGVRKRRIWSDLPPAAAGLEDGGGGGGGSGGSGEGGGGECGEELVGKAVAAAAAAARSAAAALDRARELNLRLQALNMLKKPAMPGDDKQVGGGVGEGGVSRFAGGGVPQEREGAVVRESWVERQARIQQRLSAIQVLTKVPRTHVTPANNNASPFPRSLPSPLFASPFLSPPLRASFPPRRRGISRQGRRRFSRSGLR